MQRRAPHVAPRELLKGATRALRRLHDMEERLLSGRPSPDQMGDRAVHQTLPRRLLLLGRRMFGRALVAGEKILAVIGVEEFSNARRGGTIIKSRPAPQREYSVDQLMRAPASRRWTFRRSAKSEKTSQSKRNRPNCHLDGFHPLCSVASLSSTCRGFSG